MVAMAGESSRFRSEGIMLPKWALRVGGVTLLELSLASCVPLVRKGFEVVLVVRREHGRLLEEISSELSPKLFFGFDVRWVDAAPEGQARTAVIGLEGAADDVPVAVWNVDTALLWGAGRPDLPASGHWMLLSDLPGDCWSFAAVRDGSIVEAAEKRRISDLASVGMYGFDSAGVLRRLVGSAGPGELFVAPLYNDVVAAGSRVRPVFVDSALVATMGTPSQLRRECRRRGWSLPAEMAEGV